MFLPALCYASTGTSPVSVCHKSEFYRNVLTDQTDFRHGGFFQPMLHCTVRKLRYLRNKVTVPWNLGWTPNSCLNVLGNFTTACRSLQRFVKLARHRWMLASAWWTGSSSVEPSWQYLRRSTSDGRAWPCSLSHWASSSARSTMRGVARVHLRLSTLHAKVDRINATAIGLWTIHRRSIHRASSRLTSFHKLLVIMSTRLEYMIIIKDAIDSHQIYTKNTSWRITYHIRTPNVWK